MADLIKLWLYPNVTPRIWLSQIYLWKDKIMRYLFIFISLKYVCIRDNTWRDKIMRYLLMLICFKRCLIWNDPTARRKREEKASCIPRQKRLVSWIFYVKKFSTPLHDATWTVGHIIWVWHTYLMALWLLDARWQEREEMKRSVVSWNNILLFSS